MSFTPDFAVVDAVRIVSRQLFRRERSVAFLFPLNDVGLLFLGYVIQFAFFHFYLSSLTVSNFIISIEKQIVSGGKKKYIYTTIFRETRIVSFINCTHKDKTDPNGFSHCSPSLYGRGKPHSFCLHTPVACDAVRFVICARCIQWMFPQGVLHHTRRIFTRILFLKNSGYIACILERFTTYYPLFSCSGRLENRIMFIFRYRHTVSLPSFESYDDGGCSKRKHSPFDVRAKTFCERDRL